MLLGTPKIDSFATAYTLHFGYEPFGTYINQSLKICDIDSDGYDDIIILLTNSYRIYVYRGGNILDSLPSDSAWSDADVITTGRIHDSESMYICSLSYYGDTGKIKFIPFSKSNFKLNPTDSLYCNLESMGTWEGGFTITDIFGHGNGLQDIIISGGDACVFRGGKTISEQPSFIFHPPLNANTTIGWTLLDAGDMAGYGYHFLLCADPEGGPMEPVPFLYIPSAKD